MATDPGLQRLRSIKHIVVLMMENRSFDQMLGHLTLNGMPEVNGLQGSETNQGPDGSDYPVHPYEPEETVFHPAQDPTGKVFDPCHGKECVQEQLKGQNGGFVRNFLATRHDKQGNPVEIPERYRGLVMGYYTSEHVPVYDHLARQFCVCDAWHSSIPGDTWPNRLYALAGREADTIGHKPGLLASILARLRNAPLIGSLADAPIFEVDAFTRWLRDDQWKWYSHDPATLRAADKEYRSFKLRRENFGFFNRKSVSVLTRGLEASIVGGESFLDDAANGELRDVSWIDPNFVDLRVLDPNSNDDHPPSDTKAGQALVLELYEALINSPNWNDTMLVIVYDEHGGFYDHVIAPAIDDDSGYQTLGVRVPALIVGPRVRKQVCHETFEHTSLISTIVQRFASNSAGALAAMSERVRRAPHLGSVLLDQSRSDLADHGELRNQMDAWRIDARRRRRSRKGPAELGDGAGHDLRLHQFQDEFMKFALAMREQGLPPGQP